jgi:hypothetical protein
MQQYSTPQQERSNSHGLFSHSKAEALLHRIRNTVEKHEIEITTLHCDHAQITKDIENIYHSIASTKSQIDDLDSRVRMIEECIRIPGTNTSSKVSIGEAILATRRTLAKTLNLVSEKADSDIVKESIETQSEKLKECIDRLKSDLASNDVVEKINEAITALMTRVDVIAGDMCTKVDKCMLATLSADASCIKNYANFVRTTQETTTKIQNEVQELATTSNENECKMKSINQQLQALNQNINERPSIVKLEEVESMVHSLMEQMHKKADTSSLLEMQENKTLIKQIQTIEDDIKTLYSAHQTLARHLTKRLDCMYDKAKTESVLSDYAKADEVEEKFQCVVREIMEAKACRQTLSELQKDVQSLESDLCITKRKADLAARFVGLCGKKEEGDIMSKESGYCI